MLSLSPNFGATSIADQGLALCQIDQLTSSHVVRMELPFLTLEIQADCADYIRLCRRALIDNPRYGAADSASQRVLVTDRKSRPDILSPDFDTAALGFGALIAACETAGVCGCHDTEFDSWQFFDPRTERGVQLLASPGAMPAWERAFPLRNFLHWAYAAQGRRLLHAGSLGLGKNGVLLAGAGGAGKSGTTLAGLLGGLRSVGDDYVVLDLAADGAQVFPVMRLMKQDPRGLARLGFAPGSHSFGPRNWQGKHEFDFDDLLPDSRADMLAIDAVLLPRVTGARHSKLRPATAHEVMFALLPNNLQQLPGQVKQAMGILGRLSRQLPGYHLDLGIDPVEIADTIRSFLERGTR